MRRTRRSRAVPERLPWPLGARYANNRGQADDALTFLREAYFSARAPYLEKAARVEYPSGRWVRAWRWFVEDVYIQSRKLVQLNGKTIQEETGKTPRRQWWEMLRTALKVPTMPENYYKFEFYRPEERQRATRYLNRYETKNVLFKMLTSEKGIQRRSPLTDKRAFEAQARQNGLAAVPILMVFEDGAAEAASELPKHDLFAKPINGKGGRDARAWTYDADTDAYIAVGEDERRYTAEELIEFYRKRSKKKESTYLMQPRVVTHSDLADITMGVAATCRVITILDEDDRPEPVVAAFRLPSLPGRSVDNIHAGGISSAIDVSTGTLSKATNLGVTAGYGRVAAHPATGGQIEGRVIPMWSEVKELAVAAHEAFRPRVLIGWDICVTDAGPVLVEGNAQPCVDHIQRTHGAPLGDHRYSELMAFHIRRQEAHRDGREESTQRTSGIVDAKS